MKAQGTDLFETPFDQPQIDFQNEGGETYICGNPPYVGSTWQSASQKDDMKVVFAGRTKNWKSLDYIAGWFLKAADYAKHTHAASAFVSTNSIAQGQQVDGLWPLIFESGREIAFAYTSFKWANLASHNAGVTVVIIGLTSKGERQPVLYDVDANGMTIARTVTNINAYLVPATNVIVEKRLQSISNLFPMTFGNKAVDGGNLFLTAFEKLNFPKEGQKFIRPFLGSEELIKGIQRYCLWLNEKDYLVGKNNPELHRRFELVRKMRLASNKKATRAMANEPFKFAEPRFIENKTTIVVPRVSSENREYLPVGLLNKGAIIGDSNFGLYDAPLWNLALIASRIHLVWIATVCGKLKTDYRYSNTLGWNTFPVPELTEQNKTDLTHAAEDILLARERHFPATIAELYAPVKMPEDLRLAHNRNDEILERIYIGRRFKNDTERLEKLFQMYTEMANKTPH